MNNKHQELIAEKVAEVCNKIKLDYLLKADSLLRGMCLDKELRIVLTKTLQDTIDTVLEGERKKIGAMIEEADYARKVGERTGEPIAVWEVQDVIRQIKALTPTQTK